MYSFSHSQKDFIKTALDNDMRSDGRTPSQRRASEIKTNILDNLAGSAYLSIDQGTCEIYSGVKIKVSSTESEKPEAKVFL